jgi:hypothetical protein
MRRTRLRFAHLASLLLGGLVTAGCEINTKTMNEEEFCVEYAKRECGKVATACSFERPAACEKERADVCRAWAKATKSDVRGFRPDNVDKCLEKVTETYGLPLIKAENLKALRDVCERVFQGSRKANEACTAEEECGGSLICDKKRCAQRREVSAGGNCANPGELCPKGEFCQPMMGISVCSKRKEKGAMCTEAEPCGEALRCKDTCVERTAVNLACASDDECDSGYCSPHVKRCLLGLNFAAGSPSCDAFEGKAVNGDASAGAAADVGTRPDAGSGATTDSRGSDTPASDAASATVDAASALDARAAAASADASTGG